MSEYKGERVQMNVRLPLYLLRRIDKLREYTMETRNDYIERVILEEVRKHGDGDD